MKNKKKPYELEKTFGLNVLLKLTRKSVNGIEVSENKGKLTFNVDAEKLSQAVNQTLKRHNIHFIGNE